MRGPTPDRLQRRLYHLYSSRLKKFALIQRAKEIVFSPVGEIIVICIIFIPAIFALLLAWPYLYWKTMQEQKAYQLLYENKDNGWHS